jgi:probable HAF family extracellular repeat protein
LLSYSVTNLVPLAGDSEADVFALNNAGQAVGQSDGPNGTSAVLWQSGQVFPIIDTLGGHNAIAMDINDSGTVVGAADTGAVDDHGPIFHLFRWTPTVPNGTTGGMTDLQIRRSNDSETPRIDKLGTVVVNRLDYSLGYPAPPTVYQNGLSADLSQLLPAGSGWDLREANDVNGKEIVGNGVLTGQLRAFLYVDDDGNFLNGGGRIYALPTLGGATSTADSINSGGQVAGESATQKGDQHAFLWTPSVANGTSGSIQDLGQLPQHTNVSPRGINDNGNIVGATVLPTTAFYWFGTGRIQDMNGLLPRNSGFALMEGTGINNNGWISAFAYYSSGQRFSVLLTPPTKALTMAASRPAVLSGTTSGQAATSPAPAGGNTFDYAEHPSVSDRGDVAISAHVAADPVIVLSGQTLPVAIFAAAGPRNEAPQVPPEAAAAVTTAPLPQAGVQASSPSAVEGVFAAFPDDLPYDPLC